MLFKGPSVLNKTETYFSMFFTTIEHIFHKILITVMHVDILLLVIAIILKDDCQYILITMRL